MRSIHERPMRSARSIARVCASSVAIAVLVTACAEKGFTPPQAKFSPKMALQVTITADQQNGFGPNWLLVAAGFDEEKSSSNSGNNNNSNNNDNGGGGFLGYKYVPFTVGSHTVTINVDLSRCLAYYASRGRSSCPMIVGAFLVPDTVNIGKDSTGGDDPFKNAFDESTVGPFEISAGGKPPVIPPLDLSATRYGVVKWVGDEALRLGGTQASTSITGGVAGAVSNGAVTLFTLTQGTDFSLIPAGSSNFSPQFFPQLNVFQNGQWKRVTASAAPAFNNGNGSTFVDVTALSPTEAYMSHRTGLYKFDGSAITKVTQVTDSVFSLANVVTSQAKYVIAGGGTGVVWIGNLLTNTWVRTNAPTTQRIESVCITGPTEAFAASFNGGGLFKYDGTSWTSVPIASNTTGKFGLQCPAPGQAFVMSTGTNMFRWTGTGWTSAITTGLTNGRLVSWGVVSGSEMYAYGDSANVDRAFYKFSGTSWQEVGRLRFTNQSLPLSYQRMWVNPAGGAAYVAGNFGRVERVTPSGASVISYQPSFRDVAMNSTSSAFVVGSNMFLGRWDGAKWVVDAPPPNTATTRVLTGVWSDRSNNAWAVGTSSTILRYDGNGWSVVSDGLKPVATTDSSYNAVWGSGSDIWIAGTTTIVHCKSPTACAGESSGGGGPLYSIWGTSATNVFAVGAGGRITRYNGTSWSTMPSPTGRPLYRVGGSSASDVWAVGDSVLLHFDGSAWTPVALSSDLQNTLGFGSQLASQGVFQMALWARGPKEVYIGGSNGNIARWNGFEWKIMDNVQFRRRVVGLAGAAGGCAIAVTESFNDSPAPTMWRGLGATGCFLTSPPPPTSWP